MKPSFDLVVEFNANKAFGPFEEGINKILRNNLSGSGVSLLNGKREVTGTFKNREVLNRKIAELKELGKKSKVRLKLILYSQEVV